MSEQEVASPATLDELLSKIPNRFNVVMVAAKRARQLKDGAPRLVNSVSVNPVTIALEEIVAGKIVLDEKGARVLDDISRPAVEHPANIEDLLALPEDSDRSSDEEQLSDEELGLEL